MMNYLGSTLNNMAARSGKLDEIGYMFKLQQFEWNYFCNTFGSPVVITLEDVPNQNHDPEFITSYPFQRGKLIVA